MAQNGKLMPHLDQQSTKQLNLTVLQRIDPFVEEILLTAAHVTFYEFNIEQNQWSRKDVEGSLFVVKRNAQPRFQFIVMNRRSTDNLVEDLLGDFEYEVQVPYLLYRNATQEVNGIWFYNQHECQEVANLFGRIINAYSKVPQKSKISSTKSCEFEELEAVPSSSVIEGPLEPSSSAVASNGDTPEETFVNFFSNALRTGTNTPNAAIKEQSLPFPASSSHVSSPVPSPAPALPASSRSLPSSAVPLIPVLDNPDPSISVPRASLVKPSSFFPPASSSLLMIPLQTTPTLPHPSPLHPPVASQHPYGTPLLQPFPPPTPPPTLTPTSNYGVVITKDKVRDALLRLVQNNHFVDMVYREMLNAHFS